MPVPEDQLNDDPQPDTASQWAVGGQNIGYMPEKMFYGTARAQVNVPTPPPTPNVFIRVAQDLDDDNVISYFDQFLRKDPTTRDAYRQGSINHLGDTW